MTDARTKRPQAVVDVEIDLTYKAIAACDRLIEVALEERRKLLDDGWPTGHGICEDLDEVARRWAGQRDYQARAVRTLLREGDNHD